MLTESAGAVNIEVENLFTVRKPSTPRYPMALSMALSMAYLDLLTCQVLRSDSRSQGIAACSPWNSDGTQENSNQNHSESKYLQTHSDNINI